MKEQDIINYYFENAKNDIFGVHMNKESEDSAFDTIIEESFIKLEKENIEVYNEVIGKILNWIGKKLGNWSAQVVTGIKEGWNSVQQEIKSKVQAENIEDVLKEIKVAIMDAKDGSDLQASLSDIFKKYNIDDKSQQAIYSAIENEKPEDEMDTGAGGQARTMLKNFLKKQGVTMTGQVSRKTTDVIEKVIDIAKIAKDYNSFKLELRKLISPANLNKDVSIK